MIYFLGDLHGRFEALQDLAEKIGPDDVVIQVGDFGFYPPQITGLRNTIFPTGFPCKLYAVDGNHEWFPFIAENVDGDNLWEFNPNMFYVPRGTVMEIQGKLIGFLGGACSVDVSWRKPYGKWHKEEQITQEDFDKLIKNVDGRELDVLVTHAAPPELIIANFAPLNHDYWGLPHDWVDHSSNLVAEAIDKLNPKKFVCGHMHKSVVYNNMRILDINEVWPL